MLGKSVKIAFTGALALQASAVTLPAKREAEADPEAFTKTLLLGPGPGGLAVNVLGQVVSIGMLPVLLVTLQPMLLAALSLMRCKLLTVLLLTFFQEIL